MVRKMCLFGRCGGGAHSTIYIVELRLVFAHLVKKREKGNKKINERRALAHRCVVRIGNQRAICLLVELEYWGLFGVNTIGVGR